MPMELRRPERTFTIRQLCVEFSCTPRALRFYEDKGLLYPARQGLNRVYSYRDRARLQLILRGKSVGLALAEKSARFSEAYDKGDGLVTQNALALKKFLRGRMVALQQQREDIDHALEVLKVACANLEAKLSEAEKAEENKADKRARVLA